LRHDISSTAAPCILALAAALMSPPASAGEQKHCVSRTMPGLGPRWYASLGIGPAGFPLLLDDQHSSLENQMTAAGYEIPTAGGAFEGTIEFTPLSWLTVGAEVDYQMFFDERDLDMTGVQQVGSVSHQPGYGMHMLTVTGFVQPQLRLLDGCKEEGFEMGLRFSAGGGGLFWRLRDETEAGSVVRLRLAAVYALIRRGLSISWMFGFPFTKIDDLGPAHLSHGWTWGWELVIRLGWRWG